VVTGGGGGGGSSGDDDGHQGRFNHTWMCFLRFFFVEYNIFCLVFTRKKNTIIRFCIIPTDVYTEKYTYIQCISSYTVCSNLKRKKKKTTIKSRAFGRRPLDVNRKSHSVSWKGIEYITISLNVFWYNENYKRDSWKRPLPDLRGSCRVSSAASIWWRLGSR